MNFYAKKKVSSFKLYILFKIELGTYQTHTRNRCSMHVSVTKKTSVKQMCHLGFSIFSAIIIFADHINI